MIRQLGEHVSVVQGWVSDSYSKAVTLYSEETQISPTCCHYPYFDNDKDIKEAKKMGITDINKKYELSEIIKGDSIFCATAITDCLTTKSNEKDVNALKGIIRNDDNNFFTETIVTHKSLCQKDIIKKKVFLNNV